MPRTAVRMSHVPGHRDISRTQYDTALLMRNVYAVEMRRYRATWDPTDDASGGRWRYELRLSDASEDDPGSDVAGELSRPRGNRRHPDQDWLDLAALVIKEGWDPYQYIFRQFIVLNQPSFRKGPPPPAHLSTSACRRAYHAATAVLKEKVPAAWMFQAQEFSKQAACCGLRGQDAWIHVLLSDDAQLSSLFRYAAAHDIASKLPLNDPCRPRFNRVCAEFRVQAARQLLEATDLYLSAWGEHNIPRELVENAARIYRAHHGDKSASRGDQ